MQSNLGMILADLDIALEEFGEEEETNEQI